PAVPALEDAMQALANTYKGKSESPLCMMVTFVACADTRVTSLLTCALGGSS
ncbi:hypothetical protein BaRGS_00009827, partial [Batillaria attramentaria]